MSIKHLTLGLLIGLFLMNAGNSLAGGISADAGLTPALDRWIFRTQIRFMTRDNDPSPMNRSSESLMLPLVVAYGLRPELTLMLRQAFTRMDMTMGNTTTRNSGFGDLHVMAKYRAFRYNSPKYTIGIAPLLGVELPTGKAPFTSDGLGLRTGLYLSGRRGPWNSDLNLVYSLNGIIGSNAGRSENNVLDIVGAVAHQFSFGESARNALAPVVELSYKNISPVRANGIKQPNSGESILLVSPGAKFTHSSIIFEFLVQIPIRQNQIGKQPERGVGGLLGIRVML